MSRDLPFEVVPGLEPGESVLGTWTAQAAEDDASRERSGCLVLTDRRCLFYPRAGILGGRRLEPTPTFSEPLGPLETVAPNRFWMRIGYGDRVELPGIAVGARRFRLVRGVDPAEVVRAVRSARERARGPDGAIAKT